MICTIFDERKIMRCWVLYRGRRKIVIPALLGFLGDLGWSFPCHANEEFRSAHSDPTVSLIGIIRVWCQVDVEDWTEAIQKWSLCYFALTLCTNFYSTGK